MISLLGNHGVPPEKGAAVFGVLRPCACGRISAWRAGVAVVFVCTLAAFCRARTMSDGRPVDRLDVRKRMSASFKRYSTRAAARREGTLPQGEIMAGSSGKVALITGVTGQDGAYLAEFLLARAISSTASSAAHRRSTPGASSTLSGSARTGRFIPPALRRHDRCDQSYPHRAGNAAGRDLQSRGAIHVQVSFETPEYTANADALGTLRLLEAIRILGLERRPVSIRPRRPNFTARCRRRRRRETTPFYPRSPYAAAKLYAYWITVNYREAYGMHASNGILFNHESRSAAKPSSPAKSRARSPRSIRLQDALSRQSRRQARLGPCARIRRRHVAHRAAGRARRLCAGDR